MTSPGVTGWLSLNDYRLMDYDDSNGRNDFYIYLKNSLGINAKTVTISDDTTLRDSNYDSIVDGHDVVLVDGDLTISGANCKSRTIFFVSSNLYVESNFAISNNDNACMFIVAGETIVRPSVSSIRAYIITNKFTSQESTTQLILNGGLIVQTSNSFERSYNRDITEVSVLTDARKATPSELLTYEGARYQKLLGFLWNEPTQLNIREIQYTGNTP